MLIKQTQKKKKKNSSPWATTSVVAKSCKIQKVVHFTHFDNKKKPVLVGVKLCINAKML